MAHDFTLSLRSFVKDVENHPKAGVTFKDITPLLANHDAFSSLIDNMVLNAKHHIHRDLSYVDLAIMGIESRGFVLAAPIALKCMARLILARKPGKLPRQTIMQEYESEYSKDALEMHITDIKCGTGVIIVDDILATGGTARAAGEMVQRLGGTVLGYVFAIELSALDGAKTLNAPSRSAITY